MKSFRTEFETPEVEKDIIELENKIRLFKEGKVDEEKFRSLRLARGVYGQRQQGVQMIRIKIPYGRLNARKLRRIADVCDEYSTGNLHITTRQDIQIHYVSLERTPELWAELEKDQITLREACGNTVRNVTASEYAGIDPEEEFDVTPFAEAVYQYFLRNPICQEMGRKFKIAFSGSVKDRGLTYLHDLGFIAVTKIENGAETKGFKVLLGGGLGSQPRHADVIYEFLPTDQIIPLTEAILRVFDQYGERNRRMKARLKFLLNEIGLDEFLEKVRSAFAKLPNQRLPIFSELGNGKRQGFQIKKFPDFKADEHFQSWKNNNVFAQKQKGFYAVGIKFLLGNFNTELARKIAYISEKYTGDEIRLSLRQNLLLSYVPEKNLPLVYSLLKDLNCAALGFNSTADITACPGTDTCNLGIASSTGIAKELEKVLKNEYPKYVNNKDLLIKISGCMNACGQHTMAHIGFQGMTIKVDGKVAPALQVLLGGGTLGGGQGRFADKVTKVPSKRGPDALRLLLNDFETHAESSDFLTYYDKQGTNYFYELLKPLSSTDDLLPEHFIDWGHDEVYKKAIGVGECAGVVIDLVQTLIFEAEEKYDWALDALQAGKYADAGYHAYNVFVSGAKAVLMTRKVKTNSKKSIIEGFEASFDREPVFQAFFPFNALVELINERQPDADFITEYIYQSGEFLAALKKYRTEELTLKQQENG
jgi:sulfite reductase (ferredoxin)